MPVTLGATPDHGFDDPIGLLGDCHRRIENFLGVLSRVAETSGDEPLPPDHRRALETALRYFREAAPRHTADEEESLFPRLRASGDDAARLALAALDTLEADHAAATRLHDEVDELGARWLAAGTLHAEDRARFQQRCEELQRIYATHIEAEDRLVFPAARRVLAPGAITEIGREMARRRGLRAPSATP